MKKSKSLQALGETSKTSWRLVKLLWDYDKLGFIGNLASVVVPAIVPFINAYIYARIINFVIYSLQGHHQSYTFLYELIAIRIVMLFIQDVAFTAQRRLNIILTTKIPLLFSEKVMTQLSRMDLALVEDSDFQNKFQSAKESATWRPSNMMLNLFFSVQSMTQLLVAAVSLFFLNWIFAVIIIVTAIPTFLYQAKSAKDIWYIWSGNSAYRKRYNYLYYSLQYPKNVKELKLFRLSDYFVDRAKEIGEKFANENISTINKQFYRGALSNLINVAGYAALELYIILSTLAKRISVGSLTYYTTVLINFQQGVSGLFRTASLVFDESQYVQDVFEFLDIKPSLVTSPGAIKLKANLVPSIEFKNVSFSYPSSGKKVLDNFSILIEPGQKVALVGENGAGKSTIIKLLCRLYDVDDGEILIDGINIKDIDLENWHDHLGVLFQDFLQYEYTLKDNIWFGRVDKPKILKDIYAAAAQSGADTVQKNLTKGYDQMLGNTFKNSVELSSGQWQKVALARGFYRYAPILILDEPTAAIDAKAEYEIFKRVEELTSDKTALIISHRFSTVRSSDKIFVIEHGKVIEEGSHKQLMKLDGVYADLFNLQARAYQ